MQLKIIVQAKNHLKNKNFVDNMSQDAKEIFYKIKKINDKIDYNKLVCVHSDGKIYDFTTFTRLTEQANDNHSEMENLILDLNKYNPTSRIKKKF